MASFAPIANLVFVFENNHFALLALIQNGGLDFGTLDIRPTHGIAITIGYENNIIEFY